MSIESRPAAASGTLFIVATPIGNLEDMSPRAVRTLQDVALILAEDTRVSARLLRHYGISTPMRACHDHNERRLVEETVARLQSGANVALISDAGTPLVSDPGFRLVRAAHAHDLRVVTVPGPSSVTAALSVAGLPTDRFAFEGFLPASDGARRRRLEALHDETRTMVFLEAPHRVLETVRDMQSVFGGERPATLARELTKLHETALHGTLNQLEQRVSGDADQSRGEIVLCVGGAEEVSQDLAEGLRTAKVLRKYLGTGQAAAAAAELSGISRKRLYQALLDDEAGDPPAALASPPATPDTSN